MQPDRSDESNIDPSDHPSGFIRLGLDTGGNQPFDLVLPQELATHVFLPGASGSGKTTTLTRIADGAIANWYSVIVIDCKAGGLGDTARQLAAQYEVPLRVVDPDASDSVGYNACSGDGVAVTNKLVGAFAYGPEAEIYKNIVMEALPLVVEGLRASGQDVTLEALRQGFGPRGYAQIAHKIPRDDPVTARVRARLLELPSASDDSLSASGRIGLQRRLGALQEGKFGPLLRTTPALDWDEVVHEPAVTYLALSTLASGEDVELMGRVIAQDLKQLCYRRLTALRRGEQLTPVLIVFDEFAALREAEQLNDLLVQAREAQMPVVISTQYIPESTPLQRACLSAGLIVAHRVEATDANLIASQFGTRTVSELTRQVDYETGDTSKGSSRRVEVFNVHPNTLRTLRTGETAVRSVSRERHALVQVHQDA